uniref:Uncharacterized protein n=1 Tax=Rhodopseudomonas palustris (strain DX-1) TaxID=652103 RepID=E6VQ90_RHOPX
MAAGRLSCLARNGRAGPPRLSRGGRPGEESLTSAIAVQAIEASPAFGQIKPERGEVLAPANGIQVNVPVVDRRRQEAVRDERKIDGNGVQTGRSRFRVPKQCRMPLRRFDVERTQTNGPSEIRSGRTRDKLNRPKRESARRIAGRYRAACNQLLVLAVSCRNAEDSPCKRSDDGTCNVARRVHAVAPTTTAPINANASCHHLAFVPTSAMPAAS